MPFNIAGEWVPNQSKELKKSLKKPVKVRLVKRGKSLLTVVLNLPKSAQELQEMVSIMKKKLGCGGTVKGEDIEVQGDKVAEVKKLLSDMNIKSC